MDTAVEIELYDFVMAELELHKGSLPRVAKEAGFNYRRLQKISTREIKDPRVSECQKLARYFRSVAAKANGRAAAAGLLAGE